MFGGNVRTNLFMCSINHKVESMLLLLIMSLGDKQASSPFKIHKLNSKSAPVSVPHL